jgi:hypothetical protein
VNDIDINSIKYDIAVKSCGVNENKISFNTSLDEKKAFIKACFDIDGQDLIDYFDSLDITSYVIYGDTSYPISEIKAKTKESGRLALLDLNQILSEFEEIDNV